MITQALDYSDGDTELEAYMAFEEAGTLASLAASKVVSKFGPRLSAEQASELHLQLFG